MLSRSAHSAFSTLVVGTPTTAKTLMTLLSVAAKCFWMEYHCGYSLHSMRFAYKESQSLGRYSREIAARRGECSHSPMLSSSERYPHSTSFFIYMHAFFSYMHIKLNTVPSSPSFLLPAIPLEKIFSKQRCFIPLVVSNPGTLHLVIFAFAPGFPATSNQTWPSLLTSQMLHIIGVLACTMC